MNKYSDNGRSAMTPQKAILIPDEDGCQVRIIHLDRVRLARNDEPEPKTLERLSAIFKVLADPSRLRIALALRGGEMCVCDLAALLGVSESAVSHSLRRLRDLALVRPRRDAQCLYYSLDDHHVLELLDVGMSHVNEG
jgi:ArsR family transcriptional regulator, lead/cadmium/zinc/bismuth-responsive transcriptional repressor